MSRWGKKKKTTQKTPHSACIISHIKQIRLKPRERSDVLEANQSTKGLGCQNYRDAEVTSERRKKDFGRTRVMNHSDLMVGCLFLPLLENAMKFTKMKSE